MTNGREYFSVFYASITNLMEKKYIGRSGYTTFLPELHFKAQKLFSFHVVSEALLYCINVM